MQDDRKLAVLRAIVEDYVSTEEPVGSKALVERHRLGRLAGHGPQRHGRARGGGVHHPAAHQCRPDPDRQGLPALRRPADHVKPMSAAEKRAIATFLDGAVDLDDVVHRSVRLLAQLTRQVAIVQYPTLSRSTVRHVELVALAPTRLLVVLILCTGRVEQRLVELDQPTSPTTTWPTLRTRLNAAADRRGDRRRGDRAARRRADDRRRRHGRGRRRGAGRGDVRPALRRAGRGRRHRQPGPLRRRLRLRDHARCSRRSRSTSCCSSCSARRHSAARSPCASATRAPTRSSPSTSVVATGYGPGDEALATLGIVGPTRMDYPGTMAAVRAVARYVSRILDEA